MTPNSPACAPCPEKKGTCFPGACKRWIARLEKQRALINEAIYKAKNWRPQRTDVENMKTDIENLQDGERVTLYPLPDNPLHKKPVSAIYSGGYFYCDGSRPEDGPDYYFGDVLTFCEGWTQ